MSADRPSAGAYQPSSSASIDIGPIRENPDASLGKSQYLKLYDPRIKTVLTPFLQYPELRVMHS
jgi:hypothetical protein